MQRDNGEKMNNKVAYLTIDDIDYIPRAMYFEGQGIHAIPVTSEEYCDIHNGDNLYYSPEDYISKYLYGEDKRNHPIQTELC